MPVRDTWRLLEDGVRECRMHFSIEESLLRGVDEGSSPDTLRLRRAEPSVWIGVFQRAGEDVDLEACRKTGVPVVRRHNPGGAVFQDEGTFCYSAFFRRDTFLSGRGLKAAEDLYRLTSRAVIETLSDMGLEAERTGVNDISIGGRKVYGSAQLEQGRAIVHSGTFLVSADIHTMQRLLKPSSLKFADKGFRSVEDRVINLSEAAGRNIEVEDVMACFTGRLASVLNISLVPGPLSEKESALARELYEKKYSRDEWNTPAGSNYDTTVARKVPSGVVLLTASWKNDIITDLAVRGDFLLPNSDELSRTVEQMTGRTLEEARDIVRGSLLTEELKTAVSDLLQEFGQPAPGGMNDS